MPSKLQSVLLAGLAAGVLTSVVSMIPVVGGCIACLLYAGAGVLAVWHYTSTNELTLTGGQGAGVGAMAGLASAIVGTILSQLAIALGLMPSFKEMMAKGMENMDPAQAEQMEGLFGSPAFFAGIIVVGIIIAAILGTVGGAIGASLFKSGPVTSDEGF